MLEGLLAAGISAGGKLLGGLLGPKSLSPRKQIKLQKDFMEWQWDNQGRQLKGLREGAEAAGFNPLSVLGSGSAPYQSAHLPALADFGGISAGMAISDAVQAGLSAYSAFSPAEDQMYKTTDKEVSENKSYVGNDSSITGPSAGVVLGKLPAGWEAGNATVTNPWNEAKVDKGWADAETVETRYGDIGSAIYGLGVGIADMWANKPANPVNFSMGGFGLSYDPKGKKSETSTPKPKPLVPYRYERVNGW